MKHARLFALLAGLSLAAGVHAAAADQVHASHAWIRVLPGALPGGGYVTLENHGDQPVALTGARSTAYAEVMLHHSSTQGGVSRMAMVESLPIPAHGSVVLGPGGLAFGIGGICGLLAMILGGAILGRGFARIVALGERATAGPEAERAMRMQDIEALRQRLAVAGKLILLLMVAALVLMAIGHYL